MDVNCPPKLPNQLLENTNSTISHQDLIKMNNTN